MKTRIGGERFLDVVVLTLLGLTFLNILVWLYGLKSLRASLKFLTPAEACFIDEGVKVSVIIPTRNSSKSLRRLLLSINAQDFKPTEVIVVDDGSVDNTREVVEGLRNTLGLNIKYLRLNEVAVGWVPKNYALIQGFKESLGDVLIFIDSDVWFKSKDALRRLLCSIIKYGLTSYAPSFFCKSMVCRSVETVLTTFSHAFLGFNKVFSSSSNLAWFYGCCWGVLRSTYVRLGTHESVKEEFVEDKALAKRAKKLGISFKVVEGFNYVSTEWYETVKENVEALSRVLHTYCVSRVKALSAATLISLSYLLPLLGIALGILSSANVLTIVSVLNYGLITYVHTYGAKLNNYSRSYALTTPFSGLVLAIGLITSCRKIIRWRGRVYCIR